MNGINPDYSPIEENYVKSNHTSNILNEDSFLKGYQTQKDSPSENNTFNYSSNTCNSIEKEINISYLDFPPEENGTIITINKKVKEGQFFTIKNNLKIKADDNITDSYKMALFSDYSNKRLKKFETDIYNVIKEEYEFSPQKKINLKSLSGIRKYFKTFFTINSPNNLQRTRKKNFSENLKNFKLINYKGLYRKKKNIIKCIRFLSNNLNKIKKVKKNSLLFNKLV